MDGHYLFIDLYLRSTTVLKPTMRSMIRDDCGVPTNMTFKTIIDFYNRTFLLIVGSMPTIDLFVGDDRRSVWIAKLKLAQLLTQPFDPAMTLRH